MKIIPNEAAVKGKQEITDTENEREKIKKHVCIMNEGERKEAGKT